LFGVLSYKLAKDVTGCEFRVSDFELPLYVLRLTTYDRNKVMGYEFCSALEAFLEPIN
jgi:hypothetical protein